jgi:hypothetical protein
MNRLISNDHIICSSPFIYHPKGFTRAEGKDIKISFEGMGRDD